MSENAMGRTAEPTKGKAREKTPEKKASGKFRRYTTMIIIVFTRQTILTARFQFNVLNFNYGIFCNPSPPLSPAVKLQS
jgi:hypothetical protein